MRYLCELFFNQKCSTGFSMASEDKKYLLMVTEKSLIQGAFLKHDFACFAKHVLLASRYSLSTQNLVTIPLLQLKIWAQNA